MAEHVREQIRVRFKEDTKVTAPDVSKVRKVCADCTHRNCNRIDDLCIIHIEASAIL